MTHSNNSEIMENHASKTYHGRWMSEEYEPGLVSVIIPTYNRAKYLVEAMDSVLSQTYRPIELIIVDDGSTDATKDIVEQWRKKLDGHHDFKLRYFHQPNKGAPAARNHGLIESHGEYIQFLDSDDLLDPRRLECVVHVFEKSSCDYVYTGFDWFCGRCGEVIERHVPKASGDPLTLYCENKLWGNTILFTWKRALIGQIGPWDEDLAVYQDRDFIIRTLLTSRCGISVQDILSSARRGGSSQISDIRYTREGWESLLQGMTRLCNAVQSIDLPLSAKKSLASQLYLRGVAAYPKYPDLGRQIGRLAERLGCGPDYMGIPYWCVWHTGRTGCVLCSLAVRTKHQLSRLMIRRTNGRPHVCKPAFTT